MESLVADFVKRCPIDEFMVEKLKLLLQQQMDGVLERIDEDEEQKTEQSGCTDPEDGDAPAMLSAEKEEPEEQDDGQTMAAPEYSAAPNVVGEGAAAPSDSAPNEDGPQQMTPTVDARVEEGFNSAKGSMSNI